MTRFPIALVVSLVLMLFAEQASAEGKRVAFVVGVSAYENVPTLPNAINDSAAMAELFRKAGFNVVTAHKDVGNLAFKRAIREFEDAVADADIAVVYYAGHGIEVRDQNYLIPTDAKLANERDVEDEAIALDRIINALEPAKRLRLVILDACRDNPFAGKMKKRVATRAISAGLGKVEPQMSDTLIAYAAKEKSVAADGNGEHSPFTTALLDNITVPGLDVRLAFGRVRDEVLRSTNRQQEPFVYGSLGGGTVALVPAPEVPVPQLSNADTARSDYELVERVGKKEAWQVYLNTHKTGLYADLARVQLAKLTTPATNTATDAPDGPSRNTPDIVDLPKVAPQPKPTAAEQKAWDKLKGSTDQAGIRKFIEKYPSSPLVKDAQARLDELERLARGREDALRIEREAAQQREQDEREKKATEAERKRLEREAAKHREEEIKARAAEAARQKEEALAAARQRQEEEKARAAEALAKQRDEEAKAKAAEIAERKRQAEETARLAEEERQKALAAAEAKRQKDEAAKAAAAEKAARDAEEKAAAAAVAERKRQAEEAARLAAKQKEAEERAKAAATAQQNSSEDAARKLAAEQAKEAAKAAELAEQKRAAEEKAKAAEIAAQQRQAEERAKAAEAADRKRHAEEKARAAAAAAQQRQAEERAKAAERQRDAAEEAALKAAESKRAQARAAAEAQQRKAAAAAQAAAKQQAERAAAAKAAEANHERAKANAAAAEANRRKAAEVASQRQAERAAAAAKAAQAARSRDSARAARAAPPRPVAQARPARAYGGGGGGGGAAPMVGIGF